MLFSKGLSNTEAAIFKLLKFSGIIFDPETIAYELEKHPNYFSLIAISDVLKTLKIENIAWRQSFDKLANISGPFLIHTNLNGGEFLVVTKIEKEYVVVSNEKLNKHKLSIEDFKKIFGGVVLTVESIPKSSIFRKIFFTINEVKTYVIAVFLMVMVISTLFFNTNYFNNLNWQLGWLSLVKITGLITSIFLLIQLVDNNNPFVKAICQPNSKTDCNTILSSNAAKIFEWLSWSEVGFFYFAGTLLLLLFGNNSIVSWRVIIIFNFISLPYTFYSIYYQAYIAKKWCILCCTVQGLLWLEVIPNISQLSVVFQKDSLYNFGEIGFTKTFFTLFVCLLTPIVFWIILKPLFLINQQLLPLKNQLRRFKYNRDFFNRMLIIQPKYSLPDEDWCILLGNKEASNIITMVTNVHCAPCAKMHKILDEFINHYDDLQARIVFTSPNKNDSKISVCHKLMALNELKDKCIVKKALNDWYEGTKKNYKNWEKIYPIEYHESEFLKIDKQRDWCKMVGVTGTPTFLLNGYRLPELYHLPDLKYMLE